MAYMIADQNNNIKKSSLNPPAAVILELAK
jgi:hypothetical protein